MARHNRFRIQHSVFGIVAALFLQAGVNLPLFAQELHRFDVTGADAAKAIHQFGNQSGVQIVASAEALDGKRLNSVSGELSTDEGLRKLLADTGLSHQYVGERAVAVVPVPAKPISGAARAPADIPPAEKRGSGRSRLAQAESSNTERAPGEDTPAAPAGQTQMGEVVVTARRVAESLQKVPVAVTALQAEDLRKYDIRSAADLQRFVPSLNVTGDLNRNVESFTLRGQRETGEFPGAGGGPAVVSYFAEVPSRGNGPGLYLDLQNVQVLKGPQGTLFGRNTTGGAVLFEPKRPEGEFSGYLSSSIGRYERLDVEGVINVPIVDDKLLMRAAFQSQRRDGFTRDVNTGVDYDNRDNWTARLSVLFTPNDWFENLLIGRAFEFEEDGPGMVLLASNPQGPFAAQIAPFLAEQQARGIRHTALGVREDDSGEAYGVVNRTQINFSENFSLTNLFSDTWNKRNRAADEDGTPLAIADSIGADPGGWFEDTSTLTEELRLHGFAFNQLIAWQLGGYYEELQTEGAQTFAQNLQLGFTSHQDRGLTETESRALFGQVTADLGVVSDALAGLSLTGGYRQTWDEGTLGLSILGYPGIQVPAPPPMAGDLCITSIGATYPNCFLQTSDEHSGESFLVGADYQINDDALVYGNVRRGYKSGGYNIVVAIFDGPSNPNFSFEPEQVDTVEVGLKWDWSLGGIVGRSNLALYHSSYKNVQVFVNVVIPPFTTRVVQNAAEGTITGLELEGQIRPFDRLAITYGYAYTDAEYDRYVTPQGEDRSGLPFLYTPEHQLNLGLSLDLPIRRTLGKLTISGTYSWQDDVFAGFVDPSAPFVNIESYGLANLRLDWNEFLVDRVDVSAFVNNVADEEYRVANYQQYDGIGTVVSLFGEPRTWGFSARVRF